ncbi:MAG: hypothetical protein A2W93_01730 [Bacteroidetes bacterium GWF2_43_63]|nr:MAG: hypothetical protein A2W94_10345 [Bacteroidetes bacterium GWE2_42_42]OFY55786.1 MAG: hypothetical protein A2W93_01730 [Bacteroidetes bacterium GWF2_43_63]HBG71296.1 hypothetical protein [Bacteroidales bacterium]HCB60483.1 hypothetical protein [Bacteroidales bacterium]HCY22560.1 hypothetical protein [Bacteroidales bacterium]
MKSLVNNFWIFVVFFCMLHSEAAFGQTPVKAVLSGIVIDSITKSPVEFASVAIYQQSDSSLIAGMITNQNGSFKFELLPAEYFIKISFVSYNSKTLEFTFGDAPSLNIGSVELGSSTLSLNEVNIEGEKVEKQISIEKTSIDVSQNIAASTGSISDILKSQPAITIDAENKIFLRGNSNILILLDGRPTTLTSIEAIPSSNVESIEIITNPDSKYDAEGTAGIINIVTKKQQSKGLNGAFTVNYGFNNRFNTGLGLNYRKSRWALGFNYNGRFDEPEINSVLVRDIYSLGANTEQKIHSLLENPTHSMGLSVSFVPDKKNQISLTFKSVIFDNRNTQEITGSQINTDTTEWQFHRLNHVSWKRRNIDGTLSYKRIFTKNVQELSFDIMYSLTRGARTGDYFVEDIYLQKSDGGGKPQNTTAQLDYFRPLFSSGRIETGAKYFSRWNSFYSHFYDKDSLTEEWLINTSFSNDLTYSEYIFSTYLMYSDSLSKKMFYKAGARFEYSTSVLHMQSTGENVSSDYQIPFPFALIKYQINKIQSLSASITRRVTRPAYFQLNPYIVVIDQITYETGNRYLKPELIDKLEFNYSLIKEKFQLRNNLFFSNNKRFITQTAVLSGDKLMVTYANGESQMKTGLDVDATYKVLPFFSINTAFSAFYSRSDGNFGNTTLYSDGVAWNGNLKLSFKPDKKTDIQLLLSYNSPIELPQFRLDEIYYSDFSIKRSFLKNKLSASITLSDIFNTREWIVNTNNSVYSLYNKSKNDTRILWFGITYNFNSYKPVNGKNGEPENDNGILKL